MFMVAFDLSSLVRFITRFTEESFAMLIALIFIYEAFTKMYEILRDHAVDTTPAIVKDFNCTCREKLESDNETGSLYNWNILSHTLTDDNTFIGE